LPRVGDVLLYEDGRRAFLLVESEGKEGFWTLVCIGNKLSAMIEVGELLRWSISDVRATLRGEERWSWVRSEEA
jgi:hypothetical protein